MPLLDIRMGCCRLFRRIAPVNHRLDLSLFNEFSKDIQVLGAFLAHPDGYFLIAGYPEQSQHSPIRHIQALDARFDITLIN